LANATPAVCWVAADWAVVLEPEEAQALRASTTPVEAETRKAVLNMPGLIAPGR
jgi:hypothetical protein